MDQTQGKSKTIKIACPAKLLCYLAVAMLGHVALSSYGFLSAEVLRGKGTIYMLYTNVDLSFGRNSTSYEVVSGLN